MKGAIAGLVLAGGRSSRMGGGDKALLPLGGTPILTRIVGIVASQVSPLALNANGDPTRFAAVDLPVLADGIGGFEGPLAGILTGMDWAVEQDCAYLATFPSDTPFLPTDLVQRLHAALTEAGADIAYARSGGRNHPVIGLWSATLADDLRHALIEEGIRKVGAWTARHRTVVVAFSTDPVDPFFNVNTPDNLTEAETLLSSL
ncbi:molybdenum cofactor guanylyltransferase MobA [Rhodospirillaceae bacterium KN72]|uniref:Molybdenum cofactor guanylyltransferase n=1 Tax=Pacificispira spongiicola TaxID=2729598 RepID=A0A7Y0E142_9PROT|nr:molybdenum cofactor guanylyltransferase MobA [Pacificispira spongiicola]NMM45266.1 molybdenum cofactor guanylyltransferase MobA [Pacificispira spongiicola]